MLKYKAIFFDRDETLTYFNPDKKNWRDNIIKSWSGKDFVLPYEKMTKLLFKAGENIKPWYKNIDDEKEFFKRYYYHLLVGEGVKEDLENRSNLLFDELWCNNDRLIYPEVIEVLEYFKKRGYKMGVISDTSPSLEYSLQKLNLARYFTSFTASSLVGASKPSPIIFNAALNAQGVTAEESIFVDDTRVEADGARDLGFTSFWLDRKCTAHRDEWTVRDLREIIAYIESKKPDSQ